MKLDTFINKEKTMLYSLFSFIQHCNHELKDTVTLENIPDMLSDYRYGNPETFLKKYFD